MDYNEASMYFGSLSKKGIHPGLNDIKTLTEQLGSPEKDLKFIHVAGTNGKGSTCEFLFNILRKAGLSVGIFSSPKVFSERESIRYNGRMINKEDFARILTEIKDTGCSFTSFEAETAMALLYFKEKKCDIVILEAGLGGLNDATNVIENSVLSVFTSIGMDHSEYLGETVTLIAENKAGIIKKGSFAVSGLQEESVLSVLKNKADDMDAGFSFVDKEKITHVKTYKDHTVFDYRDLKGIRINMPGMFQVKNASLATEASLCLRSLGYKITDKAILNGILATGISGRFEEISKNPRIFIDGAHNEPASLELKANLETYFTKNKIIYIMGMFRDKDARKVIENTASFASHIICVTLPDRKRSLSAFELCDMVREVNPMASTADSIEEAVEISMMMASLDKDAVIVCFGSLSFLKDIKEAVNDIKNKKGFSGSRK